MESRSVSLETAEAGAVGLHCCTAWMPARGLGCAPPYTPRADEQVPEIIWSITRGTPLRDVHDRAKTACLLYRRGNSFRAVQTLKRQLAFCLITRRRAGMVSPEASFR